MIPLFDLSKPRRLLCLGAHSDDIEIGCGGTVLRLVRENPTATIRWVVFSGSEVREKEARASAAAFLQGMQSEVVIHHFRDGFFPYEGMAIKESFEALKDFEPDLIFTHFRDDLHQDHELLSKLTWNTFRRHAILEYEIPKYDADLEHPNVFIPLDESLCRRKIELLLKHFPTQATKQWFDEATFRATLRLRGVECCSPTGWAEAFHGRKLMG